METERKMAKINYGVVAFVWVATHSKKFIVEMEIRIAMRCIDIQFKCKSFEWIVFVSMRRPKFRMDFFGQVLPVDWSLELVSVFA